ncbi:glycan metabolism protein [Niastella koreensis]|uniref:RagB/SusD domain-containing protein n=2 Tax=Niastella koreensis TaxID=354356 RepID=G8T8E1_NIAKG|nr:RagB/SusD family nutrient uptake outer membrane protein [Niastella koreensis]AEV99111.1 RagB/SusD domain-containing protein [Niastella koreensis GR20-10]OQP44022.1 glycan metabolism protein [Niastella koreensis]
MKAFNITISIISILLVFTGCRKYVDIKTQGSLIPQETINYRYLLNNPSTFEGTARMMDLAADDINIVDSAQMAALSASNSYLYFVNTYTWQPGIYTISGETDVEWDRLYSVVYNSNVIIAETPASTGGTDSMKNEIIAEAKVYRADAYLTLVNLYAKPYNATSAASDEGVPLIKAPTVDAKLTRAPVADVYKLIIDDLTAVYPMLPKVNAFNTLPSRAAAFAILARANLYMGNYEQAGVWADSALAIQNTLNNLSTLTTFSFPGRLKNPEIILSKQPYASLSYMPVALRLSDSLLNLLGTTDLRYSFFTAPASNFSSTLYTGRFSNRESIGTYETRNVGPTVPEMMLIKAEALARKGDVNGALTRINTLRQNRFTPATYTPVTAATASEALVQVINERQREFFCKGLRWFDMRRLKSDPLFSYTVTRKFRGATYTLEPTSNRYVFPISNYYRQFNPGITANP